MHGARILIVDDEPDVISMFTHALEAEHFEVVHAYDGISALDAIANDHPDLVLLDIMMPTMSGYEVLAELRADPQTQRLPVICVTSAHSVEVRDQVKASGAQALLVKPFRMAELTAQIRIILNRVSSVAPVKPAQ